jgi:hypothetical protein
VCVKALLIQVVALQQNQGFLLLGSFADLQAPRRAQNSHPQDNHFRSPGQPTASPALTGIFCVQ